MLPRKYIIAWSKAKIELCSAFTTLILAVADLHTMSRSRTENWGKIIMITIYGVFIVSLILAIINHDSPIYAFERP